MLYNPALLIMKRCNHTHWLSLLTEGNETALLESDRLQTLIKHISDPDNQQPGLLVLISNTEKLIALRELFGVKRARRFASRKRSAGEIHLHLDPSSIFHGRPILLADGNLPLQSLRAKAALTDKCHETTRRPVQRTSDVSIINIYAAYFFLSQMSSASSQLTLEALNRLRAMSPHGWSKGLHRHFRRIRILGWSL